MAMDDFVEVTEYVPALVNILSSRLTASATKTYGPSLGLSAIEIRTLVILSDQVSLPAVEVAARVGQDKGPVSHTLKKLQQAGLVKIRFAPKGNLHEISITARGKELYERALPLATEREQRLLHGFSEAEGAVLRGLLKRMIGNLDAVAQPYGQS